MRAGKVRLGQVRTSGGSGMMVIGLVAPEVSEDEGQGQGESEDEG